MLLESVEFRALVKLSVSIVEARRDVVNASIGTIRISCIVVGQVERLMRNGKSNPNYFGDHCSKGNMRRRRKTRGRCTYETSQI